MSRAEDDEIERALATPPIEGPALMLTAAQRAALADAIHDSMAVHQRRRRERCAYGEAQRIDAVMDKLGRGLAIVTPAAQARPTP